MKSILVIEDNNDVRENISEILELSNYYVKQAHNGIEGVRIAKTSKVDLILCDIMMPELDGYGVLHMLNKDPKTSNIPFIFLTAKTEKSDIRKGMNLGADDYLTKPFDDTELLEAIEIRLKKAEAISNIKDSGKSGIEELLEKAELTGMLKDLSTNFKTRKYRKGDRVFTEGDLLSYLFVIESGKIKTTMINDDGKEFIVDIHNDGDLLGIESIIDNIETKTSAEVLDESEVYLIPRADFNEILSTNRELTNRFIKVLSQNIAEKEEKLLKLAYDTVRKRVADALLVFKEKNHDAQELKVSREDIANAVGTSTESVIRTLSEFKKDGYIEIDKKGVIKFIYPEKIKEIRF
ncbi:response regulator [Marinigracilibium pacificum]|uniref:Response regulator n=1 Tax=Marinigracilibium pacificum TaxID=2729599 RepID=A0A848IUL0_9BACT|nr:response regulator [Marinigracilibium pacificum]NMM46975.1 response regulator [Marinigracilibium pacificum]